ncbi:transposase [Bradyrhizobium sp. GM5.1]|uniref:IS110 family transposase n=1 Tax=Bradyrhizobium sp. 156 TaxID=2782630 RepID=UPI001FF9440C|nr:transposase [Bradyrhizobium sp. 156]
MNRNKSKSRADRTMPMVHPNAAAIDIGATMHMAAVRADRAPEPVRSFGTFTADLHRLVDWFTECGVETVVMESTSVYWIPIVELLDARGFTVFLVNARDAKHVPGRKTCQRRAVAAAAPFVRVAASQLSTQRADCRTASLRASAGASAGVRGFTHPAYAESID